MARKAKDPKMAPSNPKASPRRPFSVTVRLLPVTIFVIALVLSVRVNDIWRGVFGVSPLSVAEAQQPPPPGGRQRGQKTPEPTTAQAPAAAQPAQANGQAPAAATATGETKAAAQPPAPAAVPPPPGGEGEPPSFTQNEIDVLQKLSERRESLESRERDLSLRENMIKAAETRIDKKIGEMKALQASVEGMLKQIDDQDQNKMKSLVKIYENMKPKEAAKIFNELDMPVLLGVLNLMKEQKIALIMEAMDPVKAKELTDAMAQKRTARLDGRGG